MSKNVIASDAALSEGQRDALNALLDTLLPASEDGRLPSAADVDFLGYMGTQPGEAIASLVEILDGLEGGFADLALDARCERVEGLAQADPAGFQQLLQHAYASYYQDERVLRGIGAEPGPPFPRGAVRLRRLQRPLLLR